jgi:alpha 1,2-mannosyltransferase
VILQLSQNFTSNVRSSNRCGSRRDRLAHSLSIPEAPSAAVLSQIWKDLQVAFDAHSPQPLTLGQPKFHTGGAFPSIDLIRNQTHISVSDAEATRNSHEEVIKKIPPYPEGIYSGQGIVMLAGGRYSDYASTGLGMLRELGSTLPVEVWMKDEKEEKPGWCKELEEEGMVCRRMSDYMDVSFMAHGYQLKINSILLSSFQQVLFLDADNVPVRNPDRIFESKGFLDTGAVLWKDYWKHSGAPILPYVLGMTDEASEILIQEEEKTVESGQLIWDKKRLWEVWSSR